MKFLAIVLALFALISTAFAKVDPTTYESDTYRVHTCRLSLGNIENADAAGVAMAAWMDKCSPYTNTISGAVSNSVRLWFVSNAELMTGDCTYEGLKETVKAGFKIAACKEQPGAIDFTKCLQADNTDSLVCSMNVDSSACVQCKNSAVMASLVGVVAMVVVVVAMFF